MFNCVDVLVLAVVVVLVDIVGRGRFGRRDRVTIAGTRILVFVVLVVEVVVMVVDVSFIWSLSPNSSLMKESIRPDACVDTVVVTVVVISGLVVVVVSTSNASSFTKSFYVFETRSILSSYFITLQHDFGTKLTYLSYFNFSNLQIMSLDFFPVSNLILG